MTSRSTGTATTENLYTCARSACEASVLIPGARASGLAHDANYVYWLDPQGSAIYRVVKP